MTESGFTGLPWIASHPWLYPMLEALHITGISLLVGSLVVLELRVWGHATELPVLALSRLSSTVSLSGFALIVMTGVLMFAAAPNELLANRTFTIKMGLVMLAGLNAAWFHARQGLTKLDGMARTQTILSLGLWLAVIICGRWIAYR